jgi:hypothetical protein
MIKNKACVKPDIANQPAERKLRLVATRGVVQLFNAIAQHQHQLQKEKEERGSDDDSDFGSSDGDDDLGPPKTKKGKPASKDAFMERLKEKAPPSPSSSASKWSALSDEFMMAPKMRDWDRKAPDDGDSD